MTGFRAEPSTVNGEKIWLVIDLDTQKVVAQGETVSEAVNNLEESEKKECST